MASCAGLGRHLWLPMLLCWHRKQDHGEFAGRVSRHSNIVQLSTAMFCTAHRSYLCLMTRTPVQLQLCTTVNAAIDTLCLSTRAGPRLWNLVRSQLRSSPSTIHLGPWRKPRPDLQRGAQLCKGRHSRYSRVRCNHRAVGQGGCVIFDVTPGRPKE
jgi:hypothetical protein